VSESHWTVLSRGDRVHGHTWKPALRGPHPVVILCSPDPEWLGRARAAWSPRTALASFDLPLHGARKSDKLSAAALDPSHSLGARLRADLEAQLASDLSAVIAQLRSDPELDPARISLVAVGIGADWARAFAAQAQGLSQVELAPGVTLPDERWLRSMGEKLGAP